jgi:hypothetical protein
MNDYVKQLEEANNKLTTALDEHRNQVELFRHIMNRCSMRMILDSSGDVLMQYVGNVLNTDKDRRLIEAYKTIKSVGTISKENYTKEMSDDGKRNIINDDTGL